MKIFIGPYLRVKCTESPEDQYFKVTENERLTGFVDGVELFLLPNLPIPGLSRQLRVNEDDEHHSRIPLNTLDVEQEVELFDRYVNGIEDKLDPLFPKNIVYYEWGIVVERGR